MSDELHCDRASTHRAPPAVVVPVPDFFGAIPLGVIVGASKSRIEIVSAWRTGGVYGGRVNSRQRKSGKNGVREHFWYAAKPRVRYQRRTNASKGA